MTHQWEQVGKIVSINISKRKGTSKIPVEQAKITQNGIIGDAHYGRGNKQISILSIETIEEFGKKYGREFKPGTFAENLTIEGIDTRKILPLDTLTIGDVQLEVTQIGKECHRGGCAIFREVGKCVMPDKGIFTCVKKGGVISVGDKVKVIRRNLKLAVITISDRASIGEYEDKSGPQIKKMLEKFFSEKSWDTQIVYHLIPDNKTKLRTLIIKLVSDKVDLIFTTGGTGIGKKDITPEIVKKLCDKEIPGLMEYIRVKYGETNPRALLSRSVAGVMNNTLVYALPGSLKAVSEYVSEILKTLEHSIFMLRGIDAH